MKYFLVIGIQYKFFKKPAVITIYLGNRFIDTFILEKDFLPGNNILKEIDKTWYVKYNVLQWLTNTNMVKDWTQLPSLFKVYEIDDHAIEGKLKIKVENSNSDYTNGFMRRSSLIKLDRVSLFKKDLVINRGEKMVKMIHTITGGLAKYLRRNVKKDIPETHSAMEHSARLVNTWPSAKSFWLSRENDLHGKSSEHDTDWWIGGSFTAELNIETKHHMKMFSHSGTSRELGFYHCGNPHALILGTCKKLLNIYDEDQRSDNTKD